MGAQLGVPYGHMGCRQYGVQFGYLDVYDLAGGKVGLLLDRL